MRGRTYSMRKLCIQRVLWNLELVLVAALVSACGGGGNRVPTGGSPSSAPSPDFALAASPTPLSLSPNSSGTIHLTLSSVGGFDGIVQVDVSATPAGVTLDPSLPFSVTPAGMYVTVAVAPTVALGDYTLSFQGTSGSLSHSVSIDLNISQAAGPLAPSGSGFLALGQQPFCAVFDPVHKLVFASLPWLDVVDVVSTVSHQLVKSIPVPGPEGLDLSLDDSEVLAGTTTNQFYTIDTTQLMVTVRTTIPTVAPGSQYIQPQWPIVTANGTILIIGTGDFPVGVFQWNPITQSLTPRPDAQVGNTARASRSADGSKILFYDSGGGGASIYDAASDAFIPFQPALLGGLFPDGGAVNPAGTQVAVSVGGGIIVTDGSGNLTQEFTAGSSFGLLYTVDGQNLLSVSLTNLNFEILAFDTSSLQLVRAAPAYATNTLGATRVLPWNPDLQPEIPLAVDDKGLIYGGADHGLALDNSNNSHPLLANVYVPVFVRWDPSEGPLNSTTNVSVSVGESFGPATTFTVPSVLVGQQSATNIASPQPTQLQFTTPTSSSPGPETIQIEQGNGTTTYLPLAFSYGSILASQSEQDVPPSGGVTADIFGYGLGVDVPNFATTVLLGGQNAPITFKTIGINPPGQGGNAYPFPVQHFQVTVPAGSPGPTDLLVTSPTGAVTAGGVIRYLKDVTVAQSTDSLSALAYDGQRQRLYVSAGDHVDVFDLSANAFVSPISLPTLHGSRKAAGLTLTPDGSELLISNQTDSSIAVINPDNPADAVAVSIPFAPPPPGAECTQGPGQIAATDTGKAYTTIVESGIDSCPSLGAVELDIPSLTAAVISSSSDPANPLGYLASDFQIVGSRTGSGVAVTDRNNVYVLNPSSGTWKSRQLDQSSNLYDIAESSDANLTALRTFPYGIDIGFPFGDPRSDRYIGVDPALNVTASLVNPELVQGFSGAFSPGMQLQDSGSLIYAMQDQEVDLYDVHHGDERERILLPEKRASETGTEVLTQTAIDETGDRIFLITQSGLTVVTLDRVPLSIGSVNPPSGSSGGGIELTIRGSGFESGASVTLGGLTGSVNFVDANTLQVTTPSGPTGSMQVKIQNPDGQSYVLDNAYTAN